MSSVNIAEALAHMEGTEQFVPEDEKPKPEPEGRDRIRLRPHEMAERRMQMAAMFAQGKYLRTIAKHFGLHMSTVSADIDLLTKEYQQAALASIGEKIAKEEALLYMIQLEATEAWFESKQGRIVNTKKRVREIKSIGQKLGKGRKGQPISKKAVNDAIMAQLDAAFAVQTDEEEPTIEGEMLSDDVRYDSGQREETSAGDPRFLAIVLDCVDRRAKLHGLYPTTDGKGGIRGDTLDDVESMTPQQRLTRLRSLLDKARMNKAQQLALNSANSEATVEAMNQGPLKESIFETRAKQQVGIPIETKPEVKTQDLGEMWDATGQ